MSILTVTTAHCDFRACELSEVIPSGRRFPAGWLPLYRTGQVFSLNPNRPDFLLCPLHREVLDHALG